MKAHLAAENIAGTLRLGPTHAETVMPPVPDFLIAFALGTAAAVVAVAMMLLSARDTPAAVTAVLALAFALKCTEGLLIKWRIGEWPRRRRQQPTP